ncbi:hypothetical protein BDK51DRAFT_48651 [Blyttiomyces helicus]|uniref:Amino acid transporter transmembrane domain-containing protein n=1 Tax=Blyttiomyces helicus TaxID=388810 RepID=A0A4P9VTY1_9FUNG|nr:hypothetical protein BDK51DRAFT_48651 [Blyttiomyces helicus]|eukprot:RKO83009.1 hypothetical protein BDK51DRAFT_48651 [Blyttiomyces helicus]
MPFVLRHFGLVLGTLMVSLAAIGTWFSLRLLVSDAEAAQAVHLTLDDVPTAAPHRILFLRHTASNTVALPACPQTFFTPKNTPSYATLARAALGRRAALAVDFAVAVSCLGFATSFLICIGDEMPVLIREIVPLEFAGGLLENRTFWMFGEWRGGVVGDNWNFMIPQPSAASTILIPLALARDVDDFWWFSGAALACAIYLAGLLLYLSAIYPNSAGPTPELPWFRFDIESIEVFCIYNEIGGGSSKAGSNAIHRVIDWSVAVCAVTYISVGLAGYLVLGEGADVILLNNCL